jgi:hypothetical protein
MTLRFRGFVCLEGLDKLESWQGKSQKLNPKLS